MGEKTGIAWTDHTFNGWWGCTEVSPGCDGCYAKVWAHRIGHEVWGNGVPRRLLSDKHWNEPLKWNAKAEAEGRVHRVFTSSMADWADSEIPREWRMRLWDLIARTPWLDWQMLTKRHLSRDLFPASWFKHPFPNVWLGVSVESPAYEYRIADMLKIPAAMYWVSAEPLIEDLNWLKWSKLGVDWWVIGGESAQGKHKARPFDVQWAKHMLDAAIYCREHDFAVYGFVKQLGSNPVIHHSPSQIENLNLNDSHGADPKDWLPELRVREFPPSAPRPINTVDK